MEKHLDIMENSNVNSKTAKGYFWPLPFGFPMYDPYNTGPMSQAVLSPAGGIVAPRRNPYYPKPISPMTNPYMQPRMGCPRRSTNPYYTKPINPMLNPYMTQYRMSMGPMAPYVMPRGPMGGLRTMSMSPVGTMPMAPKGPMGGPPPMGPPPMGPPPMGPRPF